MPVSDLQHSIAARTSVCSSQALQWREHDGDDHVDPRRDVCGIVLAGSQNWGDGRFERMLRGPLLPVAQTPLICYSLDWLRLGGVQSATICASRSTAAVREFLGAGLAVGIALDYVEDVQPRGPAGCAHDAARRSAASVFVVVEGSMIPSLDLAALLQAHATSGAAATVVVEIERRTRPGAMTEPRQPGGVYVFDRRVLDAVPARGYQDIKQGLLERLYAAGERVLTYEVRGIAPRVLDSSTYASVDRWLITEEIRSAHFLGDYERVGEALHHPTAVVHPTARIIGPVLLGAGVVVEANAVLIGPMSVGRQSVISANAVVSRSCIWEHCVIGAGANVDTSLLADHAVVGTGEWLYASVHMPAKMVELAPPSRAARASRRMPTPHVRSPRIVADAPMRVPVGFTFGSPLGHRANAGELQTVQ